MIDVSAKKVPHRIEPLMMSVNLALKTKDPSGWATRSRGCSRSAGRAGQANDDTIRKEAGKQVEALAKPLREDGRNEEADALLARLPRPGDATSTSACAGKAWMTST